MQIEEHLIVRVASLAGLALLKLVAWSDRGRETNKDAADLYRLFTAYADAGNTDRLYEVLCGGPHKTSSVASDVMWRSESKGKHRSR